MNSDTLDEIKGLVAPSLSHLGVALLDAQLSRGKHGLLRLVIDKPGGVTLEDCERVSEAVSVVLDAYDPIAGAYSLEVTSPGAERPLQSRDDWRNALGRRVNIRYHSGDGETIIEGHLVATADDHVEVEVRVGRNRQAITSVALAEIIAARIVVDIG